MVAPAHISPSGGVKATMVFIPVGGKTKLDFKRDPIRRIRENLGQAETCLEKLATAEPGIRDGQGPVGAAGASDDPDRGALLHSYGTQLG
jgi:hypothetical protein